ncbi:Os03g0268200 [Oryza sativa Japonica Group]|jgi:serine/threonine-protein kinase ULK/ATG1|uniref:Os03g0268200 protein n=1 Tax=Oryza sativa subsp. japonica TaxID=39947 RepID=A0A0N7KH01_ORYSJ|nr:hypothetical protein EE612_016700 [Oryza sativa]BAS83441.1 Os03g0268200 [Oryza sativa Japonica Group]
MGDRAAGSGGGGGGGSGVRRVGDYVLVRQIGSGAYARVWLGKHRTRGTEVALKEIAVERLSSKLRESLLSEVDILRRIRHPNVIALHESIRVPRSSDQRPSTVYILRNCVRFVRISCGRRLFINLG